MGRRVLPRASLVLGPVQGLLVAGLLFIDGAAGKTLALWCGGALGF